LYRRPHSRFVADFLGETNFIEGTVRESRDIELLVDTPCGPLLARGLSVASRRTGRVTLSIRPESLVIGAASAAAAAGATTTNSSAHPHNTIAAEHASTIYLGKSAQHRMKTTGGTELKALEGNPRTVPTKGERTTLTVDPDDVVVLGE
jgi:iron(III) transport system ATP-binding protein